MCVREGESVCLHFIGIIFMLFFFVKSNIKILMKQQMLKLKIHTTQEDIFCFFSPYPSICIQRKCLIFWETFIVNSWFASKVNK